MIGPQEQTNGDRRRKKNGGFEETDWFIRNFTSQLLDPHKKLKIMAYNSTTTLAVMGYSFFRIILWAVRILWHCFRVVVNLVLWLIVAVFGIVLFLARIIL